MRQLPANASTQKAVSRDVFLQACAGLAAADVQALAAPVQARITELEDEEVGRARMHACTPVLARPCHTRGLAAHRGDACRPLCLLWATLFHRRVLCTMPRGTCSGAHTAPRATTSGSCTATAHVRTNTRAPARLRARSLTACMRAHPHAAGPV